MPDDETTETKTYVSTVVKDGFFDDPFFSDWWKDFDAPAQKEYDVTFQRQISGRNKEDEIKILLKYCVGITFFKTIFSRYGMEMKYGAQ